MASQVRDVADSTRQVVSNWGLSFGQHWPYVVKHMRTPKKDHICCVNGCKLNASQNPMLLVKVPFFKPFLAHNHKVLNISATIVLLFLLIYVCAAC